MTILRNWHWSRWLRLGIAGAFIAQGAHGGDGVAYALGAFFGIQAVLNTGCCGVATSAPAARPASGNDQATTYQEIR